jgi:hypothetical protein
MPQSKASGIDWDALEPKGNETLPVLEVLEEVPEGVYGEGGKFKSLPAFATHLMRDSNNTLSARMIDGKAHIVRLR